MGPRKSHDRKSEDRPTSNQPHQQKSKAPFYPFTEEDIANMKDPDHPVHKVPAEKREKWRSKGINPVLRAEMEERKRQNGGSWGAFKARVLDSMSGGGGLSLPTV